MERNAKLIGVLKVPCYGTHKSIKEAYDAIAALGLAQNVLIYCREQFIAESGDTIFATSLKIHDIRHGRSVHFLVAEVDGKPTNFVPGSSDVELRVAGFGE